MARLQSFRAGFKPKGYSIGYAGRKLAAEGSTFGSGKKASKKPAHKTLVPKKANLFLLTLKIEKQLAFRIFGEELARNPDIAVDDLAAITCRRLKTAGQIVGHGAMLNLYDDAVKAGAIKKE